MAGEMFSSLSSNELARRFWNKRIKPDFGPRSAPRSTTHGRKLTLVPEVSAPSRRTDAARSPAGTLIYLVAVGLVAAAITGVFFGTGLFMLASPTSEAITDLHRNPPRVYGNAPEVGREAVLVSRVTGMPYSAAVDVLPGSPVSQGPAADEAAPPQQSKVVLGFPPAPSNGEPPAESASVLEPPSNAAAPPAFPTSLANRPLFAAEGAVLPAGAKGHPARYGRSAHIRTASQRSRTRSARSVSPRQSLFAQTLTPPQTSSFGQILTQLTGHTKAVSQALTPPRPEQPDPFAQRVWNK